MTTVSGFLPREISAMVNATVVRQHAQDAAFLWGQRTRAVGDPRYTLDDLAALDGRVDAHLEGLLVAGEAGAAACLREVEAQRSGAVFALAVLAFSTGRRAWMSAALTAVDATGAAPAELISALGWLGFDRVAKSVELLLRAPSAAHRRMGMAACAVARRDPGEALRHALGAADPALRARALRAAGELRRRDLGERIGAQLDDTVDEVRFWAAWAATLLGLPEGVSVLWEFTQAAHARTTRALEMTLRSVPLAQARELVRSLARRAGLERLVVMATGMVGDPVSVPWLIERMEDPALARLAGAAFVTITGIDLSYADLVRQPDQTPALDEAALLPPVDCEASLDWPSAALVAAWWKENGRRFASGTRHLAGRPIDAGCAIEVLMRGRQPQRAAAVIELARLTPDWVPIEIRARAQQQRGEMQRWTS